VAKLPDHLTSDTACEHLLKDKILVRNCSNFKGLSEKFMRVSLKTRELNRMVADKFGDLISGSGRHS